MADDTASRSPSNLGGARQAGILNDKQQQTRDAAIETIKRAWQIDSIEAAFPESIRPAYLGVSAIQNLRTISSKIPNLAAAQALFLNECKDRNGEPSPVKFSNTAKVLKALREAEPKADEGSTPTPKAKSSSKKKSQAPTGMDTELNKEPPKFKIPKESHTLATGSNGLASSSNAAPPTAPNELTFKSNENGGMDDSNYGNNQNHSGSIEQARAVAATAAGSMEGPPKSQKGSRTSSVSGKEASQSQNKAASPAKKRANSSKQSDENGKPQAKKQKTKKGSQARSASTIEEASTTEGASVEINSTPFEKMEDVQATAKDAHQGEADQAETGKKSSGMANTASQLFDNGDAASELEDQNAQTTNAPREATLLGGSDKGANAMSSGPQETLSAIYEDDTYLALLGQQVAKQRARNAKVFSGLSSTASQADTTTEQTDLSEVEGTIVLDAGNTGGSDSGKESIASSSTTLLDPEDNRVAPIAPMLSIRGQSENVQFASRETFADSSINQHVALTVLCNEFSNLFREFLMTEDLLSTVTLGDEDAVMDQLDLVLDSTVRHLRGDVEWIFTNHRSQDDGGDSEF